MDAEELHETFGNRPDTWFASADTLLKSAALIWPKRHSIPGVVWTALMLRGYGVENLAKGLLVQAGKLTVRGGTLEVASNHDLVSACRQAGYNLAIPPRREMLGALTNSVNHLGRYPIPKRAVDHASHTESKAHPKSLWNPAYEAAFWECVEELMGRFTFLKDVPQEFPANVLGAWKAPHCD